MAVEAEEREESLMIEKNEKKRQAADRRRLLSVLCNGMWLVLTVLVVLLCLPFALPGLLGFQSYAIISGSMEPEILTGSLVYVEAKAPEELNPGEIVTFYAGEQEAGIVTHRIVENRRSDKELLTKGDANAAVDPRPVSYGQVIGCVKVNLPYLGWLYPLMSGRTGKLRLLALLLAAVLFRLTGSRICRT